MKKYVDDYNKYLSYYASFILLPKQKTESLIGTLEKKCVMLSEKYNIDY